MKTRLCPPLSPSGAADLHRAFLEDTLARLTALAGPERALVYAPPEDRALFAAFAGDARLIPQSDGDLGQRMHALFASVFAEGAGSVVAIGADLPTLPLDHVRAALDLLDAAEADVVLGPAEDGGYYLIGLRAPRPALFEAIDWSTERVFAQTWQRAMHAGLRAATVPAWWDVDTPADLSRLAAALRADPAIAPRTRAVLAAQGILEARPAQGAGSRP